MSRPATSQSIASNLVALREFHAGSTTLPA